MKTGRCFVCLKRNHKARECRSPMTCSNCRKRHHASICGASSRATTTSPPGTRQASSVSSQSTSMHQPPKTSTSQNSQPSVVSMFIDVRTPVLLQTARAVVYKPGAPAVAQTTRIIFDTGSQRSYIASRVRNTLELLTERTETLVVKTFGSKAGFPQACDIVNVALKTRSGDDMVIPLLTVPTICEPFSGQPVTLASQRYSYLSKLDLADPSECGDCLGVGILIGADHYWALVTGRTLTRQGTGPTAIETRLGWVLSGPVTGLCSESSSVNALSCHVLKVEASQHGCSNTSLDQALRKFWDLETIGINPEESSVYDDFVLTITFRNGRYCVSLPWKCYHPPLPDNYNLCQKRLFKLITRLRQTSHVLQEYDMIIKDQINQGIVEVVEDPWHMNTNKPHYLPQHGIIREDKLTTKLRVVYDASAKNNGPSLNDCLYAGPSFSKGSQTSFSDFGCIL